MSKVTYITNGVPTLLQRVYIQEMAATALELLKVDPCRRSISLLMGYPVSMTNQQAVEDWIAEFVLDYAHFVDFKKEILPALHSHLTALRLDMMLTLPSDDG